MTGLDVLGAEPITTGNKERNAVIRSVASLVVGSLAASMIPKHPVLGFIGASAATYNLVSVAQKETMPRDATRNMLKHAVAITGSLTMKTHPVWGYLAGAIAGNLLLDDLRHDGILDHVMPDNKKKQTEKRDVIDAESFTVEPSSTALVQYGR